MQTLHRLFYNSFKILIGNSFVNNNVRHPTDDNQYHAGAQDCIVVNVFSE